MFFIIQYDQIDNQTIKKDYQFTFKFEDIDIPWVQLSASSPYNKASIEDRNKLFGRDYILDRLLSNVNNQVLESYRILGQKRVGKTSIVKTFQSELESFEKVIVVYVEGNNDNDYNKTYENLILDLEDQFQDAIENIADDLLREKLQNVEFEPNRYDLDMLNRYIKKY